MSFFRLRSIAGSVWPALCDGTVSQVWEAYRLLDDTQWMTAAEIEAGQLRQLRAVLEHCAEHVAYYRDSFREAGVSPAVESLDDFRRFPLLPRRAYQENPESFVSRTLPAGTAATSTPQTSGSSGTPTRVYQTNVVNLWWCAFFLRDLEWCGIDPRGTVASIRSTGRTGQELKPFLEGVSAPCWLPPLQGLIEMGMAHVMDISQEPRRQWQWLRRIRPDYLASYPANLLALAESARRDGPLPGLRAIQSLSDTLTDEARATIEDAFQAPVKNTYSCAEAGYLASPCPSGAGLHVHSENALVEVLDDDGQPCGPDQTGRVHITTLHNFRGPFVRYDLGDRVTLSGQPCGCGRGLPLLAEVRGKDSPMFHLSGGRRKSSTRLAFQVRRVGGHWQHQVVQKAVDHVVVRIVRDAHWTDDHAERLRREVREFFEGPMRVDVELRDHLPPPPHGKFQNMVVELS